MATQPHPNPQPNPPPQPPKPPNPQGPQSPSDSASGKTQKAVDNEKNLKGSGNWLKNEGDVIGEKPASIDFVGAYPWTNVGEWGENRDDSTEIRPPSDREYDVQRIEAEEKLAEGERQRTIDRAAKAKEKFKKQLADGTAPPPFANSLLQDDKGKAA